MAEKAKRAKSAKAPSVVSRRHTRGKGGGILRKCLFWTECDANGPLRGFCRSPDRLAENGLLGFVPDCGKCGAFVDHAEVKPCPFCGETATGSLERRGGRRLFSMKCSACGASTDRFVDDGFGSSVAKALRAWNRRAV